VVRIAFLAGVAAPLIFLGVHFSDPGNPGNANGPLVNEPGNAEPKPARFTKEEQQKVSKVLREFVLTAVDRQDVGRSWEISAPSLREGFTRKQWTRGDLPVVPYPAANRGLGRWSFVEYSYKGTVGLEVFLFPKPGSGWSAMTADVELVKGHDGNWRVDYWMPKKFHGPPAVAHTAKVKTNAQKLRERHAQKAKAKAAAKTKAKSQASAPIGDKPLARGAWWALPLGILALAILIPMMVGLVVWYRNRKAERAYSRSAGDGNPGSDS
jgi:hypothetical protein